MMLPERRAYAVRVATLLYLLEFLGTCNLLFTTPGSSGRTIPVVPAHHIFALSEQSTRAAFAALIASLVAFGLGILKGSSAVACVLLVLLQLADVTRCVCWLQIITGLLCSFALEDLSTSRFSLRSGYPPGIMVAAQWMWAGLHKLNPSFLFGRQDLLDPIVMRLTGRPQLLMPARLCGAMLEALAGAWLLYVFTAGRHSANALHRWVGFPCSFLAVMHAILLVRLIQQDWARAAWGWNILFFAFAWLFWDEVSASGGQDKPQSRPRVRTQSVMVGFTFAYAVLPALTLFGLMPAFLGHAIYNANTGHLDLQIEASSEEALAHIFPRLALMGLQPVGKFIPKPTTAESLSEFGGRSLTRGSRNVTFVVDGSTRWYEELLVVAWPWFHGFEFIIKELVGAADEAHDSKHHPKEEIDGSACVLALYTPPRLLHHGYSPMDRWVTQVCRSTRESDPARLVWKRASAENKEVFRTFRCAPSGLGREPNVQPSPRLPLPNPPPFMPPPPPLPPPSLGTHSAGSTPWRSRTPAALPLRPPPAPPLVFASPPSLPPRLAGGVLAEVSWLGDDGRRVWVLNLTATFPERNISAWAHGYFEIRLMRSSVRRTVLWYADELMVPMQEQQQERYVDIPCE